MQHQRGDCLRGNGITSRIHSYNSKRRVNRGRTYPMQPSQNEAIMHRKLLPM